MKEEFCQNLQVSPPGFQAKNWLRIKPYYRKFKNLFLDKVKNHPPFYQTPKIYI